VGRSGGRSMDWGRGGVGGMRGEGMRGDEMRMDGRRSGWDEDG
jgi:hypothetical protein